MSNPVFGRLDREWQQGTSQVMERTDSTSVRYPYGGDPATGSQPIYDQHAYEQLKDAYQAPAADAVDRGRMTYDDVIIKTLICLATLVGGAGVSWWITMANPSISGGLLTGGILVGFVLAMVNIFSKTIRPALILAYTAAEGIALGALSAVTESVIPGVVLQAVIATVVVFAVTLALFTSGKVRNSPKLMKFALIALIGILLSRILLAVLGSFGVFGLGSGAGGITVMGIPLGVVISLVAVVIGAICLISDFDAAKVGVESGAPAKYAWSCAFGMMVTVVWLYIEILNILVHLQSD